MDGFTSDEAFLNKLGERSFLRFWSWPNLFRDQGDASRSGDGKEICDLTIIFGNDIILFSDKRIEFNTEKPANIAWSRWARRAIGDSVKQIKGARRWINTYPERVFLDKKCTQKLPLEIPRGKLLRIHNVVVCHGVEDPLTNFNNEASFFFDNSIKGSDHWDGEKCRPFHIGQIFEGDFVHIFNESTIELVLNEFDTTKDFIEYLSQRESLLSSEKSVMVHSEADIIQLYYESFDPRLGERIIWSGELSKADCLIVEKGGIYGLYSNRSFLAKKAEDKVSYFWDDLIECFSFHILNGSSEYKSWDHPHEIEPSIRHMAGTGRFARRILAESFIGFYEKAIPGQRGTRLFIEPFSNDSAYLWFFHSKM